MQEALASGSRVLSSQLLSAPLSSVNEAALSSAVTTKTLEATGAGLCSPADGLNQLVLAM